MTETITGILVIILSLMIFFFTVTMMRISDIIYEAKRIQKNQDSLDDKLHKMEMENIRSRYRKD